jgi:hypothetical protein
MTRAIVVVWSRTGRRSPTFCSVRKPVPHFAEKALDQAQLLPAPRRQSRPSLRQAPLDDLGRCCEKAFTRMKTKRVFGRESRQSHIIPRAAKSERKPARGSQNAVT